MNDVTKSFNLPLYLLVDKKNKELFLTKEQDKLLPIQKERKIQRVIREENVVIMDDIIEDYLNRGYCCYSISIFSNPCFQNGQLFNFLKKEMHDDCIYYLSDNFFLKSYVLAEYLCLLFGKTILFKGKKNESYKELLDENKEFLRKGLLYQEVQEGFYLIENIQQPPFLLGDSYSVQYALSQYRTSSVKTFENEKEAFIFLEKVKKKQQSHERISFSVSKQPVFYKQKRKKLIFSNKKQKEMEQVKNKKKFSKLINGMNETDKVIINEQLFPIQDITQEVIDRLFGEYQTITPAYTKAVDLFIDGSYSKKKSLSGYGFAVYDEEKEIHREGGIVPDSDFLFKQLNSIGAELYSCLSAIQWAFVNGYKHINVHYDCLNIIQAMKNQLNYSLESVETQKHFSFLMNAYLEEMLICFKHSKSNENNNSKHRIAHKLSRIGLDVIFANA